MKSIKQKGYVIVRGGKIVLNTFHDLKSVCIDNFIKETSYNWKFWYSYGYRCVKAEQITKVI